MWAAIKSDLREFATGAAEETNVVAERVVGTRIIRTGGGHGKDHDDYDHDNDDDDDDDNDARAIPGAAVLTSIGERGLRGLSSVTSIMGGIVAPTHRANATGDAEGRVRDRRDGGAPSHHPPPAVAPSALSSMLAAAVAYGDDDDDEEELGWDDDDDLDLGDDGPTGSRASAPDVAGAAAKAKAGGGGGDVAPSAAAGDLTYASTTKEDDEDDRDALAALKSKLESVEKSRNELQNEHRRQTAELVELRSKVGELERERAGRMVGGEEEEEDEVATLRFQVEELKSRLTEQSKALSKEHEGLVEKILRQKERLDAELSMHKSRNDELVEENRALIERGGAHDDDDESDGLLLREYQRRIRDLEDELASAKADLCSASAELISAKRDAEERDMANRRMIEEKLLREEELEGSLARIADERERALIEANEARSKLTVVEGEVHAVRAELAARTSEYEEGLPRFEAESSSSSPVAAAVPVTEPAVSLYDAVPEDNDDAATLPPPLLATDGSSRAPPCKDDSDAAHGGDGMTSSPSPSSRDSGISPPIKVEVDDELSDDWGDGGWGDE